MKKQYYKVTKLKVGVAKTMQEICFGGKAKAYYATAKSRTTLQISQKLCNVLKFRTISKSKLSVITICFSDVYNNRKKV